MYYVSMRHLESIARIPPLLDLAGIAIHKLHAEFRIREANNFAYPAKAWDFLFKGQNLADIKQTDLVRKYL